MPFFIKEELRDELINVNRSKFEENRNATNETLIFHLLKVRSNSMGANSKKISNQPSK